MSSGSGRTPTWWATHVELITQSIAAVAVIAGIIGAGVGVNRNAAANDASAEVSKLRQELGEVSTQLGQERARTSGEATRADAAEAKVKELAAQLPDNDSTGDPSQPATTAPKRHAGDLALGYGQRADLDAPTDILWETVDSDGGGDLYLLNSFLYTQNGATGTIVSKSAQPQDCSKEIGYTGEDFPKEKLTVGTKICVLTTEGRYSLVAIKDMTMNGTRLQSIRFSVVTLAKNGD